MLLCIIMSSFAKDTSRIQERKDARNMQKRFSLASLSNQSGCMTNAFTRFHSTRHVLPFFLHSRFPFSKSTLCTSFDKFNSPALAVRSCWFDQPYEISHWKHAPKSRAVLTILNHDSIPYLQTSPTGCKYGNVDATCSDIWWLLRPGNLV